MYIDNNSERLFEEYKNKGFDEIYFDNKFKFIKGIKQNNENKDNYNDINLSESDLLSESFYEYHIKELNELNKKEDICEIIDSSEEKEENSENNEESVIELDETISLNSKSSKDDEKKDKNNYNKKINNLQLNNQTYKIPKKINNIDKNKFIDLKIEMNFNSIKERLKKEMLQRKRYIGYDDTNINNKKNNKEKEEVVDISSQNSINESSNFIPIDNEYAQQFSTNSN